MNRQVPDAARLEIKFVAYESQHRVLLHWLRLHPAAFTAPFPDRIVNNIYFDTHNYTAFADNLFGASSRRKIRYRWYGNSVEPDVGVLEAKCKRNYFGWKLHYKVGRAPYHPGDDWRTVLRALKEQLPWEGEMLLASNSCPVLINRYHRQYLVSSDAKIRATVDTQQAVWDQRLKPYPNFARRAHLPDTFVVEFKFNRKDQDLASQLLQGIPLRVSRHSKYINGVMAIRGGAYS